MSLRLGSSALGTEALAVDYLAVPCKLWTGATNHGYGWRRWGGTSMGAHRAAWLEARGSIPDGLFVCHRCDVRLCIEPMHLFLGSAADNNRDMANKGRSRNANSGKVLCDFGHVIDRVRPNGMRYCRTCKTTKQRERRAAT